MSELKAGSLDRPVDSSEKDEGIESRSPNDDAAAEYEYPTGPALTMVLTSVTLAYFLLFLDLAVISTATPAITSQFDSLVDVGWYGGAYQLGSAAFQSLSGKIYNQFSIKWTFLTFFLIFEVGSAISGAATTSPMFIVGRVISGVGSAGLANGAMTTIAAVLPTRRQALFLGLNVGMGQLGLATGPIIGGAFTTGVSWRWCFYINLPLGLIVGGFLLLNKIPEPKEKRPPLETLRTAVKSLDLPGFMLICPAVIMLLLGLQFGGNQYLWNSSVVIGLIIGGMATLAVFLFWEHRQGDDAMVPFAMVRHRVIWSAAMTMFFGLSSILIGDFYVAIYFQAIRNDSPLMSGVHMLPVTLGLVVFTMLSGTMISILGYYLPFLLAGGAVGAIGYGLLSTLSPSTTVGEWIGYQVLYGVAGGCLAAAPFIAIQNLVPAEQISLAMSIVILCQNLGSSVSLIVANAIFSNSLRAQLHQRVGEIGHSPDDIVAAGVRSIRDLVSGSHLQAVLAAYSKSINHVMYLGIATSCAILIFAPGLGWKDIRKTQKLQAITADGTSGSQNPLATDHMVGKER